MATPRELLDANLFQVFNNRDSVTRRAALERYFAEDVTFTDPEEVVVGRDAVAAKAEGLLANVPADFQFVADGIHYESAELAALPWAFGPVGAPVVRGIDILTIADGVIVALRTLVVEQADGAA